MKVYLSGKITGDSNYKEKFNQMEKELKSYGYVVFNPSVLPDGFEYEDYMDLDLLILSRCDAIFLLRDWKNSPGAKREYEEAKRLGLQILNEDDLKIRRTLLQLSNDTLKLVEEHNYTEADKAWAREMKILSGMIKTKALGFNLELDEETNFINLYESLNFEFRRLFIEEFIKDSDKQIEYDIIEKLETEEFEEKLKLAQMYKASAELMVLMDSRKAELETA